MDIVFIMDNGAHLEVKTDTPDLTKMLEGKVDSIKVNKGACVIYNNTNYNPKGTDSPKSLYAPFSVPVDFQPKSIRAVSVNSAVLYSESLYGGQADTVTEKQGDPDIPFEVSSMIITSEKDTYWDLFSNVQYGGTYLPKPPGQYQDPAAIDFIMKSIKYHGINLPTV